MYLNNSATISRGTAQSVGQAAEFYASEFSWRVFPCHSIRNGKCGCSKGAACTSPGKHPRTTNGLKDATTDLRQIRTWAIRHADANWAIATGNGLVVVDVDPRNGGKETFAALVAELGPLHCNHVVRTGGGGWHYYLSVSVPIKCGKLGPGVDIKGEGGYVVAAPSNHFSGGVYVWDGPLSLTKPAAVPKAWLRRITRGAKRRILSGKLPESPASDPTPDYPAATGLLCPMEVTGKRIWAAVRRCLVNGHGQTNLKFYSLAISLKNIPALRNVSAEALLPVIKWWFNEGRDYMTDQEWESVKQRWLYLWNDWSQPSIGPAWDAAKLIAASGLVQDAAASERPELVVLRAICTEMQRTCTEPDEIWFLSRRTAADVLASLGFGVCDKTAGNWLKQLVAEGALVKPRNHVTGSPWAQRYWTAEVAARRRRNPLANIVANAGRDEPLSTDFVSVRTKQLYAAQRN